jgi:hypothetical protein
MEGGAERAQLLWKKFVMELLLDFWFELHFKMPNKVFNELYRRALALMTCIHIEPSFTAPIAALHPLPCLYLHQL